MIIFSMFKLFLISQSIRQKCDTLANETNPWLKLYAITQKQHLARVNGAGYSKAFFIHNSHSSQCGEYVTRRPNIEIRAKWKSRNLEISKKYLTLNFALTSLSYYVNDFARVYIAFFVPA